MTWGGRPGGHPGLEGSIPMVPWIRFRMGIDRRIDSPNGDLLGVWLHVLHFTRWGYMAWWSLDESRLGV